MPISLLFSCASCVQCGLHSYPSTSRGQDELPASLEPPLLCKTKGSILEAFLRKCNDRQGLLSRRESPRDLDCSLTEAYQSTCQCSTDSVSIQGQCTLLCSGVTFIGWRRHILSDTKCDRFFNGMFPGKTRNAS